MVTSLNIRRRRTKSVSWQVSLGFPYWQKWGWQALAGFGIGIGLSITIFTAPDITQADLPITQVKTEIMPQKLRVIGTGQEWHLAETSTLNQAWWNAGVTPKYWTSSAHLGESRPAVVIGNNTLNEFATFSDLNLGTQVEVLGNNNLWYRYEMIEFRVMSLPEIPGWLSTLNQSLVLLVAHSAVESEWLAIIAVPTL